MSLGAPLALILGFDCFLRDSDGTQYILPDTAATDPDLFQQTLDQIADKIISKTQTRKILIIPEIISPNYHPAPIRPTWWYPYLARLCERSKTSPYPIILIKDTWIIQTCAECKYKNHQYLSNTPTWICPKCKKLLKTSHNALKILMRAYNSYKKLNHLDLIDIYDLPPTDPVDVIPKTIMGPYRIETDDKTKWFLYAMSTVSRHIRRHILRLCPETPLKEDQYIDPLIWVNNWYNEKSIFRKYRQATKVALAHLSIADTIRDIISEINLGNTTKDTDPLFVVYLRRIIIDLAHKRISIPRFRGKYIQLPPDAYIPTTPVSIKIYVRSPDEIYLTFDLHAIYDVSYESVDGSMRKPSKAEIAEDPGED